MEVLDKSHVLPRLIAQLGREFNYLVQPDIIVLLVVTLNAQLDIIVQVQLVKCFVKLVIIVHLVVNQLTYVQLVHIVKHQTLFRRVPADHIVHEVPHQTLVVHPDHIVQHRVHNSFVHQDILVLQQQFRIIHQQILVIKVFIVQLEIQVKFYVHPGTIVQIQHQNIFVQLDIIVLRVVLQEPIIYVTLVIIVPLVHPLQKNAHLDITVQLLAQFTRVQPDNTVQLELQVRDLAQPVSIVQIQVLPYHVEMGIIVLPEQLTINKVVHLGIIAQHQVKKFNALLGIILVGDHQVNHCVQLPDIIAHRVVHQVINMNAQSEVIVHSMGTVYAHRRLFVVPEHIRIQLGTLHQ